MVRAPMKIGMTLPVMEPDLWERLRRVPEPV
jgi:hypothetical protein